MATYSARSGADESALRLFDDHIGLALLLCVVSRYVTVISSATYDYYYR
jgi:hypothetical protein